ncbi:MAG: cation:proton antiporter [Candidatus Cloacimonetes bacterium]|nr:cation:proton antiporter [Candidatus Cloacimonadota bacterium]
MNQILEMLRDSFAHQIIFSTGLLLIMGYILGQFSERIKIPAITGYIFAGVLLGEAGLDLIHHENLQQLNLLSEITLSFIAVIIGCEFSFSKLKLYGRRIIFLTLAQMMLTFILITIGLLLLGLSSYVSFLLGTIGAASAPAATVVIVEKLRAKGEFVDYLFGIVALDNAGTVILFSVVFAISGSVISGSEADLLTGIFQALKEILFAIISGAIGALIIHFSTHHSPYKGKIEIISLGIIFLNTSICLILNLSPLISNMAIGMLLVNLSEKNLHIMNVLKPLTPPLYAIFFTIAGTELDLNMFTASKALLAGLIVIILRAAGKYGGIYASGHLLKLPHRISNWMGFALMPQAGVAIGLVLFVQGSPIVQQASPDIRMEITEMINIVLMSVFFNELIGPLVAKMAIKKNL